MTHTEAVAAVRRGERVSGQYSLHRQPKPQPCPGFNCNWRTLYCDGETDVVECRDCGRQQLARCNFDEEFA